MDNVRVYALKHNPRLKHPAGGVLKSGGTVWPYDQFTIRRIADGDVTLTDPAATPPTLEQSSSFTQRRRPIHKED